MTPGPRIDINEIMWKRGYAKRYPDDPEELRQIEREKRIQREIDERVRQRVLNRSEDKEEPSTPQNPT